jgi:hypothetical protein
MEAQPSLELNHACFVTTLWIAVASCGIAFVSSVSRSVLTVL